MVELEQSVPGYGFAENKGYSTADHLSAIDRLGPSHVHRRSFAPCGGTLRLFDVETLDIPIETALADRSANGSHPPESAPE
jgi:ribonuclease HII